MTTRSHACTSSSITKSRFKPETQRSATIETLKNKASRALTLILILLSGHAAAAFTINGHTIEFTDENWYEVQSRDGLTTFCEGFDDCTLEGGSYIVINHRTGERQEHVLLPGSRADPIVVENGVINWPDDGWYQVLSVITLQSICEGGTACEVPSGEYIVVAF